MATIVIASLAGSCTAFALSRYLDWNKVLASALPSLIVFALVAVLKDKLSTNLTEVIPPAFMGATFCGMSASPIFNSLKSAAVSGLFFALLFSGPALAFSGYGGALGTMACISVLATAGLRRIASRYFSSPKD